MKAGGFLLVNNIQHHRAIPSSHFLEWLCSSLERKRKLGEITKEELTGLMNKRESFYHGLLGVIAVYGIRMLTEYKKRWTAKINEQSILGSHDQPDAVI